MAQLYKREWRKEKREKRGCRKWKMNQPTKKSASIEKEIKTMSRNAHNDDSSVSKKGKEELGSLARGENQMWDESIGYWIAV